MATIGLSMIVKNEAKLILRCLESVRPLVDFVGISDTGSTDGTQDLILSFLNEHKIDGFVHDHPWQDFATNRNIALQELRKHKVDYAFMIDADDTLEITPGVDVAAFKAGMTHDVYDLLVRHAGVLHSRPQIFRNKPGFRWVGVLHEYLEAPEVFRRNTFPGLVINASIEGSRNADPQKFQKDAEILEKALKTEKIPYLLARYTFYLAQTYRDCQNYEKARKHYVDCSKMGFWDEQVYVSLFEAIRCCTRLGGEFEFEAALSYFESAVKAFPTRSEAHHAMSFLCRQVGKNKEGMEIARRGLPIKQPNGLFVEPWIYNYGLADEFAVNAYWAEHYLESLQANLLLLASEKTPAEMHKRLADNAIASLNKLTPRFVSNTSLVFSD